jgi:hypothetical protein
VVAAKPHWEIARDMVDRTISVSLGSSLAMELPTGGRLEFRHRGVAKVARERPDAAAVLGEAAMEIRMPGGENIVIDTRSRFTRNSMLCEGRIEIDGRVLFERRWST